MLLGIFALGDAKVPNANGFALQWNIGFTPIEETNFWLCEPSALAYVIVPCITDSVFKHVYLS